MNIEQILGWAYSYACNLADIGLDIRNIEVPAILTQAENDRIIDNRPLTEETLRGLGFEKTEYSDYELTINGLEIIVNNGIGRLSMERYRINKVEYKTVGSVRMLIEALKGDE